jgi:putative endonuclease
VKLYYVYILSSLRRVLYIGITGDLEKRLAYHRSMQNVAAFTARYGIHRLVHVEEYTEVTQAIAREKQLKAWRREKKVRLIENRNPHWVDLAPPTHTDSSLRSE